MVAVVTDMDQGFRARLSKALDSDRFERFISALIVLNAVIIAMMTYQSSQSGEGWSGMHWAARVDLGILAIFACEMGLKIYAKGWSFFRSGWNLFDIVTVGIGLAAIQYPLSILRSLRVIRIMRLVTQVPSMRVVVESFIRSLSGIASVVIVMLLVLFVFSVIGTTLYREIAPEFFGSLHASAFTLFTVLTLEGWPDVARDVMSQRPIAWVFFVSYVALNSFVVLNLMIAVMINAMQVEYEEHAEEEREDILAELKALRSDIARLQK